MTNPLPLRWAHAASGVGSIYVCSPDIRGRRRRAWKWVITDTQRAAELLRQIIPFLLVKRGEAMAFCALASVRAVSRRGRRRAHPEAESRIVHLIATLKSNGGESSVAAYQEALDLCIYLKQLLMEMEEAHLDSTTP